MVYRYERNGLLYIVRAWDGYEWDESIPYPPGVVEVWSCVLGSDDQPAYEDLYQKMISDSLDSATL